MSVFGRLRGAWRAFTAIGGLSDVRHPTAWLRDGFLGGKTVSGRGVSPESALTLSTYWAASRVIPEDVAKLPRGLFRRSANGDKDALASHPLHRLVHDSWNPVMSAYSGVETVTHHALTWGNGYAEIVRDFSGRPAELWAVHPSRVTIRSEGRSLVYEVRDPAGGTTVDLSPRDMLHIHGIGSDGLSGYSVATMARESIGLGLATQDFGAAFFGNDTTMGVILKTAATLKPEERRNLEESLQAARGRAADAYKFMVLDNGLDVSRTGIPPEDAQFLETRQFQVEEIARWFRVPPHKLQHLARATFSNIEYQSLEYVQDTLLPWLVRWEQEYRRKLLSQSSLFVEHNVDGLLRGDFASRMEGFRTGITGGWMSPNEVRRKMNMNPIEGEEGDRYYMQGAMVRLDRIGEEPEPPPPPAPPPLDDTDRDEADRDDTEAYGDLLLHVAQRAVRRETRAVSNQIPRVRHEREFIRFANRFYSDQRAYLEAEFAPVLALRGHDEAAFAVWLDTWHSAALRSTLDSYRAGALPAALSSAEPEAAVALADALLLLTEIDHAA